ncbi:MAG: tetratricopeptide repeat protein, partial [Anaerolineae bacterium]|nr:tetratricopeptide repeat protein [Anaerolineae bacterium]
LADYDKSIELDDELGEAFYGRGIIYSDKDQYEEALADYNKALELMGDDDDVLTSRGAAKFFLDDWQGAKDDFSQALELNEENVRAMNNRGVVEFCLEEYEAAKEDYTKALQAIPSERLLVGGMALVLHKLGDEDEALQLWKGLVATDKRFMDPEWVGQTMLWPEPMVKEVEAVVAKL